MVRDDRAANRRQRRDEHREPARLGGGVARILELEGRSLAPQHLLDAVCDGQGLVGLRAAARTTHGDVVDVDPRAAGHGLRGIVLGREARPGPVHRTDATVGTEHRDVRRHRVEDLLREPVTDGRVLARVDGRGRVRGGMQEGVVQGGPRSVLLPLGRVHTHPRCGFTADRSHIRHKLAVGWPDALRCFEVPAARRGPSHRLRAQEERRR